MREPEADGHRDKLGGKLASEDAAFITGHALVVDGGLTAQLQDSLGAFVWEEATRTGAARMDAARTGAAQR